MTFGDYLRTNHSHTESSYLLRQAVIGMAAEVQTVAEVDAWLREQGSSAAVLAAARKASRAWKEMLRTRRVAAGK